MKFLRGKLPLLPFAALLLALRPGQAVAQSAIIAPVRGEVAEAGSATPLPGAVLRWLFVAADATAPAITTTSDGQGHFMLVRPVRTALRLVVQALSYRPDTLAVPATGAPYLRVVLPQRTFWRRGRSYASGGRRTGPKWPLRGRPRPSGSASPVAAR